VTNVRDVVDVLETLAPLAGAEEWDNVGLLVGSPDWPAKRLLLTIDLTESVLTEATDWLAHMIVAYHPPIFRPLTTLTDATAAERIALGAARAGVAVFSPHTALDAAEDGVNDWLAAGLGSGDRRALVSVSTLPETEQCKVVTFCPPDAADAIRDALASIGAGRIGLYERCSFEIPGTGTFNATGDAEPAVGTKDGLQRLGEVRLEMVCPRASLALAVVMLRHVHPYEEPPVEIYAQEARPQRGIGAGRRVVLDQAAPLTALVEKIKRHLGVSRVRVATGHHAPRRYRTIGVCAGAGGELLDAAIDQGCDLYLTGEMRHHDVLAAHARGCTVILAGHTSTERGYLKVLRKRLASALGDIEVRASRRDAAPLRTM
jgi:dinuclear metal center YbgI/SA1388 family protein